MKNIAINIFKAFSILCLFFNAINLSYPQKQTENFNFKNNKFLKYNYDIKYHRFDLNINPDTVFIEACITTIFECLSSFDSIYFDLTNCLIIDSIVYHKQKCSYTHFNDIVKINLPNIIYVGEIDSISIYYHGTPSQGNGFGSFVKDYHNYVPIIWTLSQPYGSKDWWPCKNDLSDKIDSIDIIVKTPYPHRCAANGLLISETTSNGITTTHWKHKYPIAPYLIGIAVTNYVNYSDFVLFNNDTLEIVNYVFPEDLTEAQTKLNNIIPVFHLFDSLFIPYPFMKEKYGHTQFLRGGGMEHQTMTFLTDFEHGIMAHELAHSWFGNYITCASWQHIWLNEAFASYLTGLTYEFMFNGIWWNSWKYMNIQHVISEPNGSVFCYDTTNVSRIFDARLTYNKAALVLHTLRWIIGDSAFFAGINNYLNDSSLTYSYAYSNDFINKMELAANTSLSDFFNNWLYGEGYPIYDINCNILNETSVELTINQNTSHNSVDLFKLPIPILFKNYFKDTIVVFYNDKNFQTYTANIGFIPDSVIFDPDMWLIAKVNSITLNINENVKQNNIVKVFPNPTNNFINIVSEKNTINKIFVYNSLGQEVNNVNFEKKNDNHYKLDVSDLLPGLFILKIFADEVLLSKKFLKK